MTSIKNQRVMVAQLK